MYCIGYILVEGRRVGRGVEGKRGGGGGMFLDNCM